MHHDPKFIIHIIGLEMKNLVRAESSHVCIPHSSDTNMSRRKSANPLLDMRYVCAIVLALGVFLLLASVTNEHRPWGVESSAMLALS